MSKNAICIIFGGLLLINFHALFSEQNPEDAKFRKLADAYLESTWKFYPTAAIGAGSIKYADRWEELSESALEKRAAALDAFNKEFVAKIDTDKLSPDIRIDHEILLDALSFEQLRLENLAPQQYNPMSYNEIIFDGLRGLLTGETAPIEARLKSATERVRQLPGFLKTAKKNLKSPPRENTETAIRQFPAILDFYRNQAGRLIENVPVASRTKFQTALAPAISALEDYQAFLQGALLNRSTGNFRLGSEAHTKLLRLTCQPGYFMNEYIGRANADFNNIRREMFLVCIPFYKIMKPKFDIENPPAQLKENQLYDAVIAHVMAELPGEPAPREEFVDRVKSAAEGVKAFLAHTRILEIPEAELAIEALPAAFQGPKLARLLAPSPFGSEPAFSCQVSPIPEDWSPEQAQSFLEGYNSYFLNWFTIQSVYPGEFFPTYFAARNASLIRRLYPNRALLAGWPLYVQDLFVENGFGHYDLRLRLSQLKAKLTAVVDFQLELNVHQGGITRDQAIRLMTISGFQTRAEAERKWERIALYPGEAAYAYIGYQDMLDMEKNYKMRKGEAFSEQEFLQTILSRGALPLRTLKMEISR